MREARSGLIGSDVDREQQRGPEGSSSSPPGRRPCREDWVECAPAPEAASSWPSPSQRPQAKIALPVPPQVEQVARHWDVERQVSPLAASRAVSTISPDRVPGQVGRRSSPRAVALQEGPGGGVELPLALAQARHSGGAPRRWPASRRRPGASVDVPGPACLAGRSFRARRL